MLELFGATHQHSRRVACAGTPFSWLSHSPGYGMDRMDAVFPHHNLHQHRPGAHRGRAGCVFVQARVSGRVITVICRLGRQVKQVMCSSNSRVSRRSFAYGKKKHAARLYWLLQTCAGTSRAAGVAESERAAGDMATDQARASLAGLRTPLSLHRKS